MKARLIIKEWGVKGIRPKWKTTGCVTAFPNGERGDDPFICIDAFEGRADTYKRREGNCLIQVNDGSKEIFSGSFEELAELIEYAITSRKSDKRFAQNVKVLSGYKKLRQRPVSSSEAYKLNAPDIPAMTIEELHHILTKPQEQCDGWDMHLRYLYEGGQFERLQKYTGVNVSDFGNTTYNNLIDPVT